MTIRTKSESELGFEHCDFEGNKPMTSFRYLLYVGGADTNMRSVEKLIDTGYLGAPRSSRQHLATLFHSYFERKFSTHSRRSVVGDVFSLRRLYKDCDSLGVDLTVENVCKNYESYSAQLWQLLLSGKCSISAESAYRLDSDILGIIQGALELSVGTLRSAFNYTELRRRGLIKVFKIDKSNLNEGFKFGADLLDVIESFTLDACLGELPLIIRYSNAESYEYWGNLSRPEKLRGADGRLAHNVERTHVAREKKRLSGSVKARAKLLDIRVHAEFALFVAQTGMNVSVAYCLPFEDYRCATFEGGYRVQAYKPRRGSKVEFLIFSEYKKYFIDYLRFLKDAFPDGCDYLFPFSIKGEKRAMEYRQTLFAALLKDSGRNCLTLKSLREKRVNWLLRETHDPEFVADVAQHTVGTMFKRYSKPNHHIASSEWASYFAERKEARPAALDGECRPYSPEPIKGSQVTPDCVNPTGCLFCEHYEGIESFDYIWSLLTFRYLKTSELKLIPVGRGIENSPQKSVIDRINFIVEDFSNLNDECRSWRDEAEIRILEENFHDNYRALIEVRFNV
ncbi:hypothetical protein [Pseudomonas sp. TR47]|uniref:hypothetical protein n=1 Tax=Pseudomonas sp. TR47 TaxID=3342639 RepID=UPI00376F7032